MSQLTRSQMEDYLAGKSTAERGDRWVRVVAGGVSLALLVGAMLLVSPLNKMRVEEELTINATVEGLPPDIALMTKLGTLRAVAIDVAFIRLEDLKNENRFFELMQLSDWLCKLAPTYATVWSYSAWNMSYNISVCQYGDDARWLWVNNGIDNLRTKGIVYNPKSITLYKELSWIFIHKIGDKLDDSHLAYKAELAVEMERIFGEPPLVLEEAEALDAFREIVDAPRNLNDWIDDTPEVKRLVEALAAVELSPDESLLNFVAEHMRTYSNVEQFVVEDEIEPSTDLKSRRKKILSDPANIPQVDALCSAVRSDILRDPSKYNMDLDYMLELMEEYGPLDWRSPYAHSLYWASLGDKLTKGVKNIDEADSMNAVRFIFFALESLSRNGKIILEPNFEDPGVSFINPQPDTSYIRHMHEAYLKFGKEQFGDDPRFIEGTAGPNYSTGHENFLMRAIRQLYLAGGKKNQEEAKEYYFYLRNYDLDENGMRKVMYEKTFKAFIEDRFKESLDTQAGATVFVQAFLLRSMKEAAVGQVGRSLMSFAEAKKWWKFYMRDVETDRNARRKLQPLGVMRRDAALSFMQFPGFSAQNKSRVWRSLDLETRKSIYDEALPIIEQQCAAHVPPFDPFKVMPTPPGMAEHRKDPKAVLAELEHYDPSVSRGKKQLSD